MSRHEEPEEVSPVVAEWREIQARIARRKQADVEANRRALERARLAYIVARDGITVVSSSDEIDLFDEARERWGRELHLAMLLGLDVFALVRAEDMPPPERAS